MLQGESEASLNLAVALSLGSPPARPALQRTPAPCLTLLGQLLQLGGNADEHPRAQHTAPQAVQRLRARARGVGLKRGD